MGFFSQKKKTILIIDDSSDIVEILKARIEANDFIVLTAMSGKEGIEKASSNPIDVIILDIMMPEMDGFEVCRRLKKLDATKTIPIVMLSALGTNMDPKRHETLALAKELGAVAFVTKPYIPADVFAGITLALQQKR